MQNSSYFLVSPGMPFHDKQTWIAVTDGNNIKYNKKYYFENFLTLNIIFLKMVG